jgi:uncharacterized small protein (DUF1192 family)
MADLTERIANLEAEIESYKKDLKDAGTPEEKSDIRRRLTATTEALIRLLDQQNAQFIGI